MSFTYDEQSFRDTARVVIACNYSSMHSDVDSMVEYMKQLAASQLTGGGGWFGTNGWYVSASRVSDDGHIYVKATVMASIVLDYLQRQADQRDGLRARLTSVCECLGIDVS